MRVERINFQTLNLVPQHDVVAVIGKRRPVVEVSDSAVSRREDGINWFTAVIALQTANVQSLVHLPAFTPHTTETATGPRFADSAHEEFFFLTGFKERAVRRR